MRYILLLIFLSACTSELREARIDPNQVIIRDPIQRPIPISAVETLSFSPSLKGFWQYGLLSTASYEPQRQSLNGICSLPSKYALRWLKDSEFSDTVYPPKRQRDYGAKVSGLGYSVWEDKSASKRRRVALVFRGTDFNEIGDWYSNARWITRFIPVTWDQYQQTRDLVEELVSKLKSKYGDNVEIVATGHSLGGGLAQHAAYSSRDIKTVYAFASSPVTGSTSLDRRVDPTGVTTFRVYESGEILAGLRWISRRIAPLTQMDPDVKEARFSFRSRGKGGRRVGRAISQHSIQQLTCDLICRVELKMSNQECTAMAKLEE